VTRERSGRSTFKLGDRVLAVCRITLGCPFYALAFVRRGGPARRGLAGTSASSPGTSASSG